MSWHRYNELFRQDWELIGVQYIPTREWLQMRADYHAANSDHPDPAYGQVCLFTFN
jgi:hypothetical protein